MNTTMCVARVHTALLVIGLLVLSFIALSADPSLADKRDAPNAAPSSQTMEPQAGATIEVPTTSADGISYLPLVISANVKPNAVPALLTSYVVRGDPDYRISWSAPNFRYRPRQFVVGLQADSGGRAGSEARVDDTGSYSGWDILNTPNLSVNTFASRADWFTFLLNRPATVAIVWRGGNPVPTWLSSWNRGGDVVLTGKSVPTYVRAFPAGEVRLGGVYEPGSTSTVSRDTYLILLAEADGTPSKTPPVPAGKELPQPNQTCPAWVHAQYVTTGPDGKTYPTWHPQIDPVYWCYFRHEHGSDPSAFIPGYTPAYGYTASVAGVDEPHAGFKTYVLDDHAGHRWILTHHFGTSGLKRACVRFHTVDIAVADTASHQILADLHFMGDFGKSVAASADSRDVPLTPPDCPNQATLANADGTSGVRKIHVATRDTSGYEPWRIDDRRNILGLKPADLTFATGTAVVICNELTCDQPVTTGSKGEFRFLTFNSGFGITAGPNHGEFYCDVLGRTPMSSGQPGAIRQYVQPGLNLSDVLLGHGYPLEPWKMVYGIAATPPADSHMDIEGALQSPN
jgi:hypothetical protein